MISLDYKIINLLHQFSKTSPAFTDLMQLFSNNDFLNGGLIVSLLWFFWFHNDDDQTHKREQIVIAIIGTLIAIIIGRLLTNILPFRLRPVLNPHLVQFYPNPLVANSMRLETSMPSDHAVMFYALATGIFYISKKIGILAFLYVSVVICFPRVYLGLHYGTDILVGAVIGIITPLLFTFPIINKEIKHNVFLFYSKFPGLFYLLFFLLTYQIGTMFDSSRELMHFLCSDILQLY